MPDEELVGASNPQPVTDLNNEPGKKPVAEPVNKQGEEPVNEQGDVGGEQSIIDELLVQTLIDGIMQEVQERMGVDATNNLDLQELVLTGAYHIACRIDMDVPVPNNRKGILRIKVVTKLVDLLMGVRQAIAERRKKEESQAGTMETAPTLLKFPTAPPPTDEGPSIG